MGRNFGLVCPDLANLFVILFTTNNDMKKYLFFFALVTGCAGKPDTTGAPTATHPPLGDTLTYQFKASYSSDITSPGNRVYAQKVLQVWKYFETGNIKVHAPTTGMKTG